LLGFDTGKAQGLVEWVPPVPGSLRRFRADVRCDRPDPTWLLTGRSVALGSVVPWPAVGVSSAPVLKRVAGIAQLATGVFLSSSSCPTADQAV